MTQPPLLPGLDGRPLVRRCRTCHGDFQPTAARDRTCPVCRKTRRGERVTPAAVDTAGGRCELTLAPMVAVTVSRWLGRDWPWLDAQPQFRWTGATCPCDACGGSGRQDTRTCLACDGGGILRLYTWTERRTAPGPGDVPF